jgi:general secretion pathway protein E
MAQRLVRTLCPHCKQPAGLREEDEVAWNNLVAPWKSTLPATLYRPVGCLDCRRTGYQGRMGLYEILLMSPEIKKRITDRTDIAVLREQALREGMKTTAHLRRQEGGRRRDDAWPRVCKVAPPTFERTGWPAGQYLPPAQPS